MGYPIVDAHRPKHTYDVDRPRRPRAPPPLDALQPARRLRRARSADHGRGRGLLPLGRAAASATSTRCPASSPCSSGTAAPELADAARASRRETLEYFPIWSYAPPARDRARGQARRARARRPQPRLLHHRRLRGGRVGVEAGPPVLPRHRPARPLQGDRARHRVPRHHARARSRSPASPRCRSRSSRSRPATSHVMNTNTLPPRARATTTPRSCSSPTDAIEAADPRRGPGDRRRGVPRAGAERGRLLRAARRATSSGCARSATATACCSCPTRSSARSAASATCSAASATTTSPT